MATGGGLVEAAAGRSGSVQVSPGSVRSAGEQATQISQAIRKLVPEVSSACSPAASAHNGWQFGATLDRLIPRWETHLAQQASAVSAAGSKLTGTATVYTTTEDGLVSRVHAVSGLVSP